MRHKANVSARASEDLKFMHRALREAERAVKNGKAKFSDWNEARKRIRRKAANLA